MSRVRKDESLSKIVEYVDSRFVVVSNAKAGALRATGRAGSAVRLRGRSSNTAKRPFSFSEPSSALLRRSPEPAASWWSDSSFRCRLRSRTLCVSTCHRTPRRTCLWKPRPGKQIPSTGSASSGAGAVAAPVAAAASAAAADTALPDARCGPAAFFWRRGYWVSEGQFTAAATLPVPRGGAA